MRRYFIVGSRIDELLRLACLPFLPTKPARLRCVLVAHWLARVHRELIVNVPSARTDARGARPSPAPSSVLVCPA